MIPRFEISTSFRMFVRSRELKLKMLASVGSLTFAPSPLLLETADESMKRMTHRCGN